MRNYPICNNFIEACNYCEALPPDYIPSQYMEIFRTGTIKHPRSKNAFFIGLTDGAVLIGNYENDSKIIFTESNLNTLTDNEKRALIKRTETLRREFAEKKKRLSEEVASKAIEFIQTLKLYEHERNPHPYFLNKKVFPPVHGSILECSAEQFKAFFGFSNGLTYRDGRLLVFPLTNGKRVTTLQFISEDGRKTFLKGGEKLGAGFIAIKDFSENEANNVVVIAEGVATLLSVINRTEDFKGLAVSAMDSGNLKSVAGNLLKQYPNLPIVILADNDPNNAGLKGAEKAKIEIVKSGGVCSIQLVEFSIEQIEQYQRIYKTNKLPTDWNDYYNLIELGS